MFQQGLVPGIKRSWGRGGQDVEMLQASSQQLHMYGIERLQSEVLSLAMTSLERYPHCLMEKLGKEVRK